MKRQFVDHLAETRQDFLDALGTALVTIVEVYDGVPNHLLEEFLIDSDVEANLIRFDMQLHSVEGRARFCSINEFEQQCYGLPKGVNQKPLPYFSSYVRQIGHTAIAWSLDEVKDLARITKEEAIMIMRLNEKYAITTNHD